MLSLSRKGPAYKPQFRVCYLCGQQFGSASIGIHIPQCYAKKVSQWEVGDPATRGRRPKHPDTVNWNGDGVSKEKLNDEQFREFTSNLVPCERCGRKFFPDRLVVHLRSCKGDGGPNVSRGRGGGGGDGGNSFNKNTGSVRSSSSQGAHARPSSRYEKNTNNSPSRAPGYKPVLPICYLCGQQFGSSSIAIHVPQCYAKKLSQWEAGDVNTRGKPPKHPDTVNWMGKGVGVEEHNDAQFSEFVSNLEPCPHCGRRFLADRLVVHLRSCKPGSTSRPLPKPSMAMVASNNSESQNTTVNFGGKNSGYSAMKTEREESRPKTRSSEQGGSQTTRGSRKLSPMVNRIPKNGGNGDSTGRTCTRCGVVEYDISAKYCRDCGTNLVSKTLPIPCVKCKEPIPESSRFCGTCGFPINGAMANERTPGVENVNAPTIRVLVCPACQAVCDADGNFCDNCGGALGDVEPSITAAARKEVMFCGTCREIVEELAARFCEECGGVLEKVCMNTVDDTPHERPSTVQPDTLKFESTPKPDNVVPGASAPPTIRGSKVSSALPKTVEKCEKLPKQCGEGVIKSELDDPKPPQVSNGNSAPLQGSTHTVPHSALMVSQDIEEVADVGELKQCGNCGRKFNLNVLAKHERVCAGLKQRKVFNMRTVRTADCDVAQVSKTSSKQSAAPVAKKDWRAESEAFRRSMREARLVDKVLKSGGNARDLPPPTYSENSHYTPCPHCGRKFAPDVAERHIPRCAMTLNKPKPPPKRR